MTLTLRKILPVMFAAVILITAGAAYGQDIKVDTIKVNKTRIVRIVKVMTVPKFTLSLSGGFNAGAMELTSHNGGFSREDFLTGKNFGTRFGLGVTLTGKLPLHKKGHFWLDIIASFNRFQSDLIAKNTIEGSSSYNVIGAGVGVEYNFTPYHKVKYYVGANPLLSIISGKASLTNPDNDRVNLTIKTAVRIGYSIFTGLDYAIEKNFGLNCGLKFTHANLLLKKTEDFGTDPTQIGLNDNSSETSVQFGGWKQFAYVTAYAGISYFFGVKVNRYKLP